MEVGWFGFESSSIIKGGAWVAGIMVIFLCVVAGAEVAGTCEILVRYGIVLGMEIAMLMSVFRSTKLLIQKKYRFS